MPSTYIAEPISIGLKLNAERHTVALANFFRDSHNVTSDIECVIAVDQDAALRVLKPLAQAAYAALKQKHPSLKEGDLFLDYRLKPVDGRGCFWPLGGTTLRFYF